MLDVFCWFSVCVRTAPHPPFGKDCGSHGFATLFSEDESQLAELQKVTDLRLAAALSDSPVEVKVVYLPLFTRLFFYIQTVVVWDF